MIFRKSGFTRLFFLCRSHWTPLSRGETEDGQVGPQTLTRPAVSVVVHADALDLHALLLARLELLLASEGRLVLQRLPELQGRRSTFQTFVFVFLLVIDSVAGITV